MEIEANLDKVSEIVRFAQLQKISKKMGISDLEKKYMINELCRSEEAMFAATGVTDGTILKGVSFLSHGAKTHSLVMRAKTKTIRFIEAHHSFEHFPEF